MEYVWGKDVLHLRSLQAEPGSTMNADAMAASSPPSCAKGSTTRTRRRTRGAAARPHPPRHLAAEHPHQLRRRGQDHRLRHRQGGVQPSQDAGRRAQGQVRLHDARAGARAAARSPLRHLRHRHVLYELLTGERLFMGESDFETLEKVRNVDRAAVDLQPPHRRELERIINKALARTSTSAISRRSSCTTSCRRSCTPPASSTRARIWRRG